MMRFLIRYIYQASRMLWLFFKPISVGVRVLMVKDEQVLLVKHVYQPDWYLPGGAVEQHETLEQAAQREAQEETGATIQDICLFGVYTNYEHGKSDHIIVYLSQDFELTGEGDDEIEFCGLFPFDTLPEKISPGSANRIQEYLAGKIGNHGDW
jgi:8-oxo-dGTP pyrophosphatase MutT (NUDIX family)